MAITIPSPRLALRRDAGLLGYEKALQRCGFSRVAGVDEAGRGACAGPLVAAAVILPANKRGEVPGLADSKLLSVATRERLYDVIVARALSYAVVTIPAAEIDAKGLQVCNVQGLRRAVANLTEYPDYVLSDGFPVDGLGSPALAMWKGDRVAACVAAASILAKVTRDRIMTQMHAQFPHYGFGQHMGYVTAMHTAALREHGPCVQHRFSYTNVASALRLRQHGRRRWRRSIGHEVAVEEMSS